MKAKELYLAKNLEELNKIATVNSTILNEQPKKLFQSADKLLVDAALREDRDKDEEHAYVQYMKYLAIVQHALKSARLPNTEKEFYKKIHTVKKLEEVFVKCRRLSDSLAKRYDCNQLAEKLESAAVVPDNLTPKPASAEKKGETKLKPGMNGVHQKLNNCHDQDLQNDNAAGDLTPKELKNLIDQRSTPLLIVDCRAASDFVNAHVDHPNCISVPSEMLVKGLTANKIGESLKTNYPGSYVDWTKRGRFEKIILYDWSSSFERKGEALQVVYDAITQWDFDTKYKSKPYVILGGLRNIYYQYPTLVNKPENVKEGSTAASTNAKFDMNKISYPELDEEQSNLKNRSNQHSAKPHSDNVTTIVVNGDTKPLPSVKFDRSTKPSASKVTPIVNGYSTSQNGTNEESLPVLNNGGTLITTNGNANIGNNNSSLSHSNTPSRTPSIPKNDLPTVNHGSDLQSPLNNGTGSAEVPKVISKDNGLVNGYSKEPTNGSLSQDESKLTVIKNDLSPPTSVVQAKPSIPDPKTKPARSRTNTSPGADNSVGANIGGSPQITIQKLKDDFDSPRSSILKRSHSNPNISQLSTEVYDDDISSSTRPDFNRSLKPSSRSFANDYIRRRDFDVVSSTAKAETGLKNLGNTCYMNSIMQCINHTQTLVHYFLSHTHRKELNKERGPSRGEVTEEVARAIIEMNKGHRSIGLHDLKTAFGKFNKTFRSSEQQDSHEFLTFLLDHMHEELNKARKQPLKEQKNDGLPVSQAADIAWKDYLNSNDSIITELFCGQQKSSVKCISCGKSSTTFDTFFVLSIPIPDSRMPGKIYTLHECLDLYTAEEEINDWGCANCRKSGRAKKKIDLWRLPPILIIHFQRFYVDSYCKKRITEIDFPVDELDLRRLVPDQQMLSLASWRYQLYGTSNHYGTMDSGHYTAYCRKFNTRSWAKFDDQEVCAMLPLNVPSAAAYILFFSQH